MKVKRLTFIYLDDSLSREIMSIREIAKITGLSTATVSHALNGTKNVSIKNKQKILEAAKSIGYRPNIAAKVLKTNRSKTIALVIPRVEPMKTTNYFYMDIIAGVDARFINDGYFLIIGTYQEALEEKSRSLFSLEILKNRWVDGLLLVPNSMDRSSIMEIKNTSIPLVLIDRRIKDANYDFVVSDNENGAYNAVQLMCQKNRKKIAFVGSMLRTSASYERYLGYARCLNEYGLNIDKNLIIYNEQQSIENGMNSAAHLLSAGIDGIFVSDNILLMGVYRHLKQRGIQIGKDISLVGYDDYEWMQDVDPPITTVKQNPFKMGYIAANVLIERLHNEMVSKSEKRQNLFLNTELILRRSH